MITARLFRLYRLPSPASISTAASVSSAISSTKILEPTLRRVAVSGNEICHGALATSGLFATSWTRYRAYSTDKSGDGQTEQENAPQSDISTSPTEEVKAAAADPPAVNPQCDEESRATMSTAADSPDQSDDSVTSAELSSDGQSDSVSPPASETDSSPAEPVSEAGTVNEAVAEADNTAEAAVEATVESNADAVIQDTVEPVPLSPTSPPTAAPSGGLHVHVLSDRALIRVEGTDTQALLQGLVTQDLDLLNQSRSVYAMMLNLQGRVLYDVIIYNVSSPLSEVQKYLVECDAAVASDIVSHLKKYKLRKSCDIVNVSDVFEVSSVRPTTERMANLSSLPRQSEFAEAFDPILIACRDPRLKDLGWRLISGKGFDVSEALGGGAVVRPLVEYREQRYKLGVAEGILDLEPGKTFPLESNLVFLNGVSFSKGCYLGQELTARTHHTGVIRKRIMPLILSTPISSESGPFPGNLILNTAGKDAGKFRDAVGVHGIGLVRVNMSGGRLIVVGKGKESECYARMPHWWPMDDPSAVLGDEGEEELVDDSVAGQHQESAQNSS